MKYNLKVHMSLSLSLALYVTCAIECAIEMLAPLPLSLPLSPRHAYSFTCYQSFCRTTEGSSISLSNIKNLCFISHFLSLCILI